MKHFILALAIVCFAPSLSQATDNTDKLTMLAIQSFIDYHQTVKCLDSGGIELNPILGKQPSKTELFTFGLVSNALVFGIDQYFAPSRFKTILIDSIIKTEQVNIEWNKQLLNGHDRPYNTIVVFIKFEI